MDKDEEVVKKPEKAGDETTRLQDESLDARGIQSTTAAPEAKPDAKPAQEPAKVVENPDPSKTAAANPEANPQAKSAVATPEANAETKPAAAMAPEHTQTAEVDTRPDPYSYHQGGEKPEEKPAKPKPEEPSSVEFREDPYAYHQGDASKLPADIQRKLAEYKENLEKSNFSIAFQKGEGPWNSLMRQRQEAQAKKSSGKELTAQEAASLAMTDDQILKESRRMRDRDFKAFKDSGDNRNWYKLGEKSERYTRQDIEAMVKAEGERLVKQAEEAQKKAEADKARQEAEAKQREIDEAQKKALMEAVDKHVPKAEAMQKAADASGLKVADMNAFRERLKAHVAFEVMQGSLKPEDLSKPMPRIGSVFVAAEAFTPKELQDSLAEQQMLRQKAKQGEEVPRIGDLIRKRLQGERLARFDQTSKFYDELKKALEAPPAQNR